MFFLISGSALTGLVLKFLRSEFPKVVKRIAKNNNFLFLGDFGIPLLVCYYPSFRNCFIFFGLLPDYFSFLSAVLKKTEEKFQVPEGRFKKIAKNAIIPLGCLMGERSFCGFAITRFF